MSGTFRPRVRPQESSARIQLNADVRTCAGEEVGRVTRVVIDPRTTQITHFVLESGGRSGCRLLVTREQLERARPDGEGLRLDLTAQQVERLPTYVAAVFDVPPAGWAPPRAYRYPAQAFVWRTALSPDANGPGAPEAAWLRVMDVTEMPPRNASATRRSARRAAP